MPHVIVKLWPGESERKKARLAEAITKAVEDTLGYGEESVSVAFYEIDADRWAEEVYRSDIQKNPDKLYKKPGYTM